MSGRLGGLIDQPNILGTTYSRLNPSDWLSPNSTSFPRLLCFGAIVGMAVAIILTGSRGSTWRSFPRSFGQSAAIRPELF